LSSVPFACARRTAALALLAGRLQRCRFVTVVGPGGVGKTTVAVAIADQLRSLQILIVLDNCERIAQAVAQLAERLLKAAPLVQVLVTSREPLRAEGESVYRLPTLDAPPTTAGLPARYRRTVG
jgi:predicted ATPase